MGYSWALSGRVTVKSNALAAFQKAKIDPARFDDWPDDWGEPGCDAGAMTAREIIDAYAKADAGGVEWTKDGVAMRAVFSNDSDLWLTYRSHLAAALRAAADFGGTSDVAITGYLDGAPETVFRVVARDGKSELEVLTARAAKPVAAKVHADVQPLVDALVAKIRGPIARDPNIERVHQRVCAALREIPPADVMNAVKHEKEMFDSGSNRWKRFDELFGDAPAYIDALASGFDGRALPAKVASVALRVLVRAAPARGAELAKAYVDEKRSTKALDVVRTEARALLRPVAADPKKAAAAIARLRKIAPKTPKRRDVLALQRHPDLRQLCETKSPDVLAAARKALDELTAGSKLARLKNDDHMYVLALTLVLEAGGRDEDWDALFRIWSEAPGFILLQGERIMNHGERGMKWLAPYFGKISENPYARFLQLPASRALFTLDADAARRALAELVGEERPTEAQDSAASNMVHRVGETKASPAWAKVLVAAASHSGTTAAHAALGVLANWKDPNASKLVLAEMGKSLTIEQACSLLEAAGDASAVPALRKHLKSLGPKERGDRNRVEQCISALGG